MIRVEMNDIYGTSIKIQESGSGYFRLDFSGKGFGGEKDNMNNEIPSCVSLNENMARALQSSLNSYFEED